ncbi:peroxisome proliferator-activated receptor gamma coactivator-related protein 1-like [Montipora foliosa]|uniref:peroxisome proliferator-activated receptor gamma coactivator-related protein 1-like n=1 Tax=Montipora foliosa TaxID=591990 RepID=UPI0035F1C347
MEIEEGELIEGIEANDVSALLEQFLKYEEKQGSLDCSSTVCIVSSKKVTSGSSEDFVQERLNSNRTRNPTSSESENGSTTYIKKCESSSSAENGGYGHVKSKNTQKGEQKNCVDNHETDHNYACSGFPLRKAPLVDVDLNGYLGRNASSSIDKKSPALDLKEQCEKVMVNKRELTPSIKRGSYEGAEKKSRIPKRYRGRYCEDSSDDGSSFDEDDHYDRRQSSDSKEQKQRRKRVRKGTYSSNDEENYYKIKKRRHSISSDERNYSSSDESDRNEQMCRCYPRRCKCSMSCRRHCSGSDKDSSMHHRRKRRCHSRDHLGKDVEDEKDKEYRDVELKRKMGFKFDQNIKGTGKEERRIVYVGKISNKTTKDDVWRRFRPFGPIEKVTVHFRDDGDNYAFVTFFDYSSAAEAIERGNEDSSLPELDLCFGGRRNFCGGSYVDFDSNISHLEEGEVSRPPSSDEMDFDALLRLSQNSIKKRRESSYKGR